MLNQVLIRYLSGIPGDWRPTRVTASGSTGTATSLGCVAGTEDTITLLVDWESGQDTSKRGTAVYTASWTAPNGGKTVHINDWTIPLADDRSLVAGVHSEQYFHYMGSKGEVRINQARRGVNVCYDGEGTTDVNRESGEYYTIMDPRLTEWWNSVLHDVCAGCRWVLEWPDRLWLW